MLRRLCLPDARKAGDERSVVTEGVMRQNPGL